MSGTDLRQGSSQARRPALGSVQTWTWAVMEVAEAGYARLIAGRGEIVPGSLNKLGIGLLPFLPKSITLAVISRLQQNRAVNR
jgi:short-subunit dehydrogenase